MGDLRLLPPAIWRNDLRIIANYTIAHTRLQKTFRDEPFKKKIILFRDPFYTSSLPSRTLETEKEREKK